MGKGMKTLKKNIFVKHFMRVFLLGIIICSGMIIFWTPLCKAIDVAFLPLFSDIENDRIGVVLAITVCIAAVYCLGWKSFKKEAFFSFRKVFVVLLLVALSFFRIYVSINGDKYIFSGVSGGSFEYFCIALIEIFLAECICIIPKIRETHCTFQETTTNVVIHSTPFLPDIPTEKDKYGRSHYAEILVEKIISTQRELKDNPHCGSFNILLSECYGFGKTSFLLLVERNCKERNVDFLEFRPWLCDNPDSIVKDFFNLLSENYLGDRQLTRLLKIYSDVITSGVSNKVAKTILSFSKGTSVEALHDDISEVLRERTYPCVIAIDDVDRLQYRELDALIRLIRNTADFPNIFYLIAADKKAITQMLSVEGNIQDPEHYLQKFFNYEMLFPASEDCTISEVLNEGLQEIMVKYKNFRTKEFKFNSIINNSYIKLCDIFHQPRDVYRYLNMLSFELDNLNNEIRLRHSNVESIGDNDICLKDLMKVLIIRYLMPEIYKIFRDNNDNYFLDLQKDGKLVLANEYSSYFNNQFSRRYDGRVKLDYSLFDFAERDTTNNDIRDGVSSFEEIIKKNVPQREEIVLSIFRDLWSTNRPIDNDLPSINKHEEFFRYFSGRWERDKVSIYEAKAKMMMPAFEGNESCEEFKIWLDDIASNNKMESLIHKTSDIVNGRLDITRQFDLFVNIFTCIRKQIEIGGNSKKSIQDYYKEWDKIIIRLLRKEQEPPEDYYQQFCSLFAKSNEFELCSLLLMSINDQIISYNEYKGRNSHIVPCIFTVEQHKELSKLLIDRFFSEIVIVNPYDINTLERHFYCRMANVRYWETKFHEYLKGLDCPLVWLYGAFYWYEKEQIFFWNDNVINYIYNYDNIVSGIESLLGNILPSNYKDCLKKMPDPIHYRGNGFEGEGNQLLADVREWQLKEQNPFPKLDWLE